MIIIDFFFYFTIYIIPLYSLIYFINIIIYYLTILQFLQNRIETPPRYTRFLKKRKISNSIVKIYSHRYLIFRSKYIYIQALLQPIDKRRQPISAVFSIRPPVRKMGQLFIQDAPDGVHQREDTPPLVAHVNGGPDKTPRTEKTKLTLQRGRRAADAEKNFLLGSAPHLVQETQNSVLEREYIHADDFTQRHRDLSVRQSPSAQHPLPHNRETTSHLQRIHLF